MIRSLRRKFILIAMLSVAGTLAVLCAAVWAGNSLASAAMADRAIDMLYQNRGSFPPPGVPSDPASFAFQVTPETPFEMRYAIVELTRRRAVRMVDTEHIAAMDRQAAVDSILRVIDSGRDSGYMGFYRYRMFRNQDGGSTVIVLDCFRQLQTAANLLRILIFVSLSCALIVFVLLVLLSRRAIRPFVENLERQRQFVTDASHELKTPLAILSADVGLLRDTYGEDRFLKSAQTQVLRLDKLIRDLVELARTEETVREEHVSAFSVSEIAQASADAFLPAAEADGKTLAAEIAPDVRMRGVKDDIFRLFSILLDNAVKYCDPGGEIRFALFRRGRSVCVSVSNPCAGLDASQLPRYFDRFYRADSSRARSTGGYGIGLSTARAIVTRHRGRITNRYDNGVITFTAVLPQ